MENGGLLHQRARSMLEEWARQTAAALVGYARAPGAFGTIVLEDFCGLRGRLMTCPGCVSSPSAATGQQCSTSYASTPPWDGAGGGRCFLGVDHNAGL